MGFLQDLGGFINEVNSLTDELDTVKNEVVNSLVDGATSVKQTLDETASEISHSVSDVQATIQQSTTLPGQLPADDDLSD